MKAKRAADRARVADVGGAAAGAETVPGSARTHRGLVGTCVHAPVWLWKLAIRPACRREVRENLIASLYVLSGVVLTLAVALLTQLYFNRNEVIDNAQQSQRQAQLDLFKRKQDLLAEFATKALVVQAIALEIQHQTLWLEAHGSTPGAEYWDGRSVQQVAADVAQLRKTWTEHGSHDAVCARVSAAFSGDIGRLAKAYDRIVDLMLALEATDEVLEGQRAAVCQALFDSGVRPYLPLSVREQAQDFCRDHDATAGAASYETALLRVDLLDKFAEVLYEEIVSLMSIEARYLPPLPDAPERAADGMRRWNDQMRRTLREGVPR